LKTLSPVNYVRWLALIILVPLIAVVILNAVVDPLAIFRVVSVDGFNQVKPKLQRFSKIAKPITIETYRPEVVVFGSSRTEFGINPRDSVWNSPTSNVYNAGQSASTVEDVLRLVSHTLQSYRPREILIGVEYFMFNAYSAYREPMTFPDIMATDGAGEPQPFHRWNQLTLALLSRKMVSASVTTLKRQAVTDDEYSIGGQRRNALMMAQVRQGEGFHQRFAVGEAYYARRVLTPCRNDRYDYQEDSYDSMDRFAMALDWAAATGVPVKVFISPSHVRLVEVIDAIGLLGSYYQWKRDLNALVMDTQRKFPGADIQLWDFSVYNEMTMEPVPADNQRDISMRWYVDTAHYSDHLGHEILRTMYSQRNDRALSGKVGTLLGSSVIERHIENLKSDREAFRRVNPEVVENVAERARQMGILRNKQGRVCS